MSPEHGSNRRWVQQEIIRPRLTNDGKWQIGRRPHPEIEKVREQIKQLEYEESMRKMREFNIKYGLPEDCSDWVLQCKVYREKNGIDF